MAVEYVHQGVRVNCVCPGFVETNIAKHMDEEASGCSLEGDDKPRRYELNLPIAKPAQPRDVAHAVAYLASGDAAMVTGTSLMVDGGYTAV